MKPRIIVHGGAFNIPETFVERYRNGTKYAAKIGYNVLLHGGSALDAVEAAVQELEDDPAFNAGHGSALTEKGTVEMDAIIVDGKTLSVGAVTCVQDVSNPVSLARKVMEKTSHCFLCGEGATEFAKKIGHPIMSNPKELITKDAVCKSFTISEGTFDAHIDTYMNRIIKAQNVEELEAAYQSLLKENTQTKNGHDTVGAVAIDNEGNIACATSTGGMPGKMLGRIGDSPIFGCGAYANTEGGCSATGHGESLIRSTVCREAVFYLEQGHTAQEAARKAIDKTLKITNGHGGVILIDKFGNVAHAFTTGSMAWASMSPDGMKSGLRENEELFEENTEKCCMADQITKTRL